ncbi:peptidoglycan-binding domain-containing protein [Jonesiaceae bacterium BS-20]|uniref:Peptidoglycan-binding domain-containing protein n=1 Tax=Jonesiaceae bacterium BS-20 TaxID=3120821 RepID=A0AAU7E087_9MICO
MVFLLGTLVRSPWDSAGENAEAVLIPTAVVSERDFSASTDLVRGRVELGSEIVVNPTVTTEERAVVTALLADTGSTVRSGDALAKVSGQPLLLLHLDFPLYRTVHSGDEGDDVVAVQQELKRLGLYTGRVDGKYGAGTAAAVKKLYEANGLSAPTPAPETPDSLERETEELSSAGQEKKETSETRPAAVTPLKAEHFWALAEEEAKLVELAPVGTELGSTDTPLARLQVGEAQLTVRVPTASNDDYTMGAQGTAFRTTDEGQSWAVKISAVGDFTTEPHEFANRPGRDVTFEFETTDGLETGAEMYVELDKVSQPMRGLAVPLTGLREDKTGPYVDVLSPPQQAGDRKRVSVVILGTGDGFAHVESTELAVGDVVVVGN